ncbi:MAG TPA: ABC transporter ATP-binding protein [Acidimicrobiales bacterium]|nr:ABC transporter ATP-binding protein [Acidimicrobiales bacterium]
MSEPAVLAEHVSKRFRLYHERNDSLKVALMRGGRAKYEEFWALKDVSLEVPKGSTFGLIGENGSGKSTLLKCMARILRPDKGRTAIVGKTSALLEVGAGFHPELSGRDNVYLNGSILGLSKKELDAKFDGIVEFAGLERFIDTPVKNYSSGMYVRLGFSVAINVDPDVLLVDEILAVGDENFQRKCAEKFADLHNEGKTIVVVSHALGTVRNLCDHVALLEHGVLKQVGTAADVIDNYMADAHVARHDEGIGGSRWGSGEGRIDKVEIIGRDGVATQQVRTGERVTFRLHYSTSEPIARPVFGIGITTLNGIDLSGPNTRDVGVIPEKVNGSGVVDMTVEDLPLLAGTYDLAVGFYDYSATHPYDHRLHALRFDVEPGTPRQQHGFVALDATWTVDGASPRLP